MAATAETLWSRNQFRKGLFGVGALLLTSRPHLGGNDAHKVQSICPTFDTNARVFRLKIRLLTVILER